MSIIIYTRNDCVQCHATKRAMESRGVDFEMVNIDLVPEAADTLRAQGFRQLPVVGRVALNTIVTSVNNNAHDSYFHLK